MQSRTSCEMVSCHPDMMFRALLIASLLAGSVLAGKGGSAWPGPVTEVGAVTALGAEIGADVQNAWTDQLEKLPSAQQLMAAAPLAGISESCRDPLQYMRSHPLNGTVMKMIDASTKVPEGVLAQSWLHLGNWDECVNVEAITTPGGTTFHGQHCILALKYRLNRKSEEAVPFEGVPVETLAMLSFKVSVCVPSTCSDWELEEALDGSLKGSSLQVEVTCTIRDPPALDTEAWVGVGLLVALAAVVAASTAYDLLKGPGRSALLAAFSAYSNGRKLLAAPRAGDATLSCVHGIRFISMAWVVYGHTYMNGVNLGTPNINMIVIKDMLSDWKRAIITSAPLSVDTFFMLSGLLVAYVFLKQVPRAGRFNLPLFYLHRYIRLTPALAVMVLLNATLLPYMGWGPLWQLKTEGERINCRKNWWNVLLYLNNYVDPSVRCVGQSWYLMVDMQLHWLSPLLLLPMWKWPRLGLCLASFLGAAGLVAAGLVCYFYKIPPNMLLMGDFSQETYFRVYYGATQMRFVPYVIGAALGYWMVSLQASGRKIRLSSAATVLLWLAAAALLLVPLLLGTAFLQPDYSRDRVAEAFFNSLHRPVWSLGVATVIFLCSTGHGRPVNGLLSWSGFQLLGRLSYTVFLVHMSLQTVEAASVRTYTVIDDMVMVPRFFGDLAMSLLLGAVLSLATEAPFMVLEKQLLGGGGGGGGAKAAAQDRQLETAAPQEGGDGLKTANGGV